MTHVLPWFLIGAGVWLAWALAARAALRASLRGDVLSGLVMLSVRFYARAVHHLRVSGGENVPASKRPGPLIIVANHTAGADPVLVQAACPFEIRWVMAEDMRVESLNLLWDWAGVIFVDRVSDRGTGVRSAIDHLRQGGVLGVFPEGRIETPEQQVLPFQPGLALIAARTGAPILPVIIEGTPQVESAWGSLWRRSRSRLRFLPLIETRGAKARGLSEDLRDRFLEWTGWPANDAE